MADEIPTLYTLESIEQMRAMADDLRLRILQVLAHSAMTVTEVGRQLAVPANKTHYHVRELERVGLVRQVETRERGGVLEKYFRAVARDFNVPSTLLRGATDDEGLALVGNMLQSLVQGFLRAAGGALKQPEESRDSIGVSAASLWLTRDEHREVMQRITALLDPYIQPRDIPGAREHTFALLAYVTPPAEEADQPSHPPAPSAERPAKAKRRTVFAAGAVSYTRAELESAVAAGERLDINVVGACNFADDIPADLVDHAIGRFRHHGNLTASPKVRAVLACKEQGAEA
jgi:DNA-binding transcriptional ArsR family regulator